VTLTGVTAIVFLSSKKIKGLHENPFTIDQLLNRSGGLAAKQ
jgi:hypothetical protein